MTLDAERPSHKLGVTRASTYSCPHIQSDFLWSVVSSLSSADVLCGVQLLFPLPLLPKDSGLLSGIIVPLGFKTQCPLRGIHGPVPGHPLKGK